MGWIFLRIVPYWWYYTFFFALISGCKEKTAAGKELEAFFVSDTWLKLLPDRVEPGDMNKGAISWDQGVRLCSEGKSIICARTLLAGTGFKRKDVIKQYHDALQLKSDGDKNKATCQTNCGICHQFGDKLGIALGLNLFTAHAWPVADIIPINMSAAIILANTQGEVTNISREDISGTRAFKM